MKKLILISVMMYFMSSNFGQTPQAFKYQAVARNSNGNLIQNQQVAFRIGILQGGPSGNLVYRERQIVGTNEFGLANLEIGKGIVLIGSFSAIDWSAGQMFMKVDLDPTGGIAYINMGSFELLSVPYALYADSCSNSSWHKSGNDIYYNNGKVGIGTDEADSSNAILELNSTDKGFLPPRMSQAQIENIQNPEDGMMVYCTTDRRLYIYDIYASVWTGIVMVAPSIIIYCGLPFRDTRDGQVYNTVKIGTQCWMKENLNFGAKIDAPTYQTDNRIPEKYCWGNDTYNCSTYGGLYGWSEMMKWSDPGDICPQGFHVPSSEEWCTLLTFVDPTVNCTVSIGWTGTDAGGKLKESGTTHWTAPNTGATDESGFTARPGNAYLIEGFFLPLGTYGNFWGSDGYLPLYTMVHDDARIYLTTGGSQYYSVRCLKDN
jgi:uncharacterized protein (TIGR02145 family)